MKYVFTESNYFICSCSAKFGTVDELSDHMCFAHKAAKEHTCEECNRVFSTKILLSIHMFERHIHDYNMKELPETISPAIASQLQKLQALVHVLTEDTSKFKCTQCSKLLSSERTLNAHVRQVHQKHTHNQFCPHCKFSTYEKYRLDKHIEQHNEVKKFQCELCDYLAVNKKAVEDHVRSKHSKGKKRKYDFWAN